ncbi:MAG: hypothetical protein ACLR23_23285 [Clostridia bacterium]
MALFLEAATSLNDCIAFPVLHGSYGEDGTIQGFFEMAGIPYVETACSPHQLGWIRKP